MSEFLQKIFEPSYQKVNKVSATALRENESTVTGDPEFRKLEKEIKIDRL